MTSQEAYKIMCEVCDKAEKYDKMINVLQEIKDEIEKLPCGYFTVINSGQAFFIRGKDAAIKVIDRKMKEYTE